MLNTLMIEPTKSGASAAPAVTGTGTRKDSASGASDFESHMERRQADAGDEASESKVESGTSKSTTPDSTSKQPDGAGAKAAAPADRDTVERDTMGEAMAGATEESPVDLEIQAGTVIGTAQVDVADQPVKLPMPNAVSDISREVPVHVLNGPGATTQPVETPVQTAVASAVSAVMAQATAGGDQKVPQPVAGQAAAGADVLRPKDSSFVDTAKLTAIGGQAQPTKEVAAPLDQPVIKPSGGQQGVVDVPRSALPESNRAADAGQKDVMAAAPAVTSLKAQEAQIENEIRQSAVAPERVRSVTVQQATASSVAVQMQPGTAAQQPGQDETESEEGLSKVADTEAPRTRTEQTWRAVAQPVQQQALQQQMQASSMMSSGLAMQMAMSESAVELSGSALLSGEMVGAEAAGLNQLLTEALVSPGTVHRPEVPRAVAQQMAEAVAAKGDRNIEIALSPEELGRVKMRLSASESGMTVMITTERPETGDLMRKHINELAEEFRRMGYENIAFEFSGESTGDSDANGGENGTASGRNGGLMGTGDAVEEAAPLAVQQELRLGETGLDMRM